MEKFNFGESLRILLKTTPYLIIRTGIYAALGVVIALYLGLTLFIGKIFGGGGLLVFLIGLGVLYGLVRLAKQYLLYMVDAGHVAVITEIIQKGSLPEGVNQFQYGKELVLRMYKEVSALFLVDQLVNGAIRAINSMVANVADFLPLPGIEGVAKIANSVINFSLTYVDETILSYNLASKNDNVWDSARRGVILYAQNWKPILIAAAGCAAANFVAFIAILLIMLVPFGLLASVTHNETLKLFWFGFAFAMAYGIKLALFKPFFQISIILTFTDSIRGQVPNPEWEQKIESVSEKFRELKEKATNYTRSPVPPDGVTAV